jgi:hypothetical protein
MIPSIPYPAKSKCIIAEMCHASRYHLCSWIQHFYARQIGYKTLKKFTVISINFNPFRMCQNILRNMINLFNVKSVHAINMKVIKTDVRSTPYISTHLLDYIDLNSKHWKC